MMMNLHPRLRLSARLPWSGARLLAAAWLLGTSSAAFAGKLPDGALEELPTWRTQGTEVQFAAIRELLKMGSTYAALDIIRKMRADHNDSPELDLLQGQALRMDGVASEAERLLSIAQKRLGRDGRPSAELCILYADLRRIEDAIAACERATDLDPDDAPSWNNLGFLLLSSERADEAVAASEKALQIDATQPRYRNNLGMAQAALGREDLAFRTLKSTMPLGDAAYMVGLARERFSSLDEAEVWMERAIKYDPQHPEARAWLDGRDPSGPLPSPGAPPPNDGAPAPDEVP
jgi:Flp pilus assembly protein TadD